MREYIDGDMGYAAEDNSAAFFTKINLVII